MVVDIQFQWPGDKVAQFKLASVRFQQFMGSPFKGLKTDIVDWFETAVEAHWRSKGSRGPGKAWPALADSTAAGKGSGQEIMIKTGDLVGALIGTGPHQLRTVKDDHVELGVDFGSLGGIYPLYHQADARGKAQFPRRRVVDMTKDDGLDLMQLIQDGFRERARANGFTDGRSASGVSRAF